MILHDQDIKTELQRIYIETPYTITAADLRPEKAMPDERYTERLYHELGRIAHMGLPDKAVNGIVKHYPLWHFNVRYIGGQSVKLLHRRLQRGTDNTSTPLPLDSKAQYYSDLNFIALAGEEVTGADMQFMIDIQRQLTDQALREAEARKPTTGLSSETAAKFNMASERGGPLNERVQLIMSLSTVHFTNAAIARACGTSETRISRLLKPAHELLGSADSVEFMLASISLGIASIEHIPRHITDGLSAQERNFMHASYSPDPAERITIAAMPAGTVGNKWFRIREQLLAHTKHEAVLYAVRDGVIALPNRYELASKLNAI